MMNCQEYIFKLSSGQLDQAGRMERFQAAQHRWICKGCRAFARNDKQLDAIIDSYKTHLSQPAAAPPSDNG